METCYPISISHFLKLLEISWLLTGNSLLKHPKWIDFTSRFNHNFDSLKHFAEVFPY